jgi:hypothetical protein
MRVLCLTPSSDGNSPDVVLDSPLSVGSINLLNEYELLCMRPTTQPRKRVASVEYRAVSPYARDANTIY